MYIAREEFRSGLNVIVSWGIIIHWMSSEIWDNFRQLATTLANIF